MKNATKVPRENASVVHNAMRHAAVLRKSLGLLQNVPNAANRVNQRPAIAAVNLAAQTIDMNIHNVGAGVETHAPNVVQDHRTSNNPACVAAKILQQRELLGGELEHVIAPARFAPYQVKLEIRSFKPHRFRLRSRRSTQQVSQPCEQFSNSEWLRQIVIAAVLETLDALIDRAPGRQNQDWSGTALSAATRDQIKSISVRQGQINDERIMNTFQGQGFGTLRVSGRVHLIPRFQERACDEPLDR